MAWLRQNWGLIVTGIGLVLGTNGAQYAERVNEPTDWASDRSAMTVELMECQREIGRWEGRNE